MFLQPKETTRTINFDELKSLLLSNDLTKLEDFKKLSEGGSKFLDRRNDMIGNRVAFDTFPRTGNSFLRKLTESTTGVFNGIDIPLEMALSFQ